MLNWHKLISKAGYLKLSLIIVFMRMILPYTSAEQRAGICYCLHNNKKQLIINYEKNVEYMLRYLRKMSPHRNVHAWWYITAVWSWQYKIFALQTFNSMRFKKKLSKYKFDIFVVFHWKNKTWHKSYPQNSAYWNQIACKTRNSRCSKWKGVILHSQWDFKYHFNIN